MKEQFKKFGEIAKGKAIALGSALSMAAFAPSAFAQDNIGTTVKTLVEGYGDEALIAIMALIVVAWTLRATGVLKPRG